MKKYRLSKALGEIDEVYIEEVLKYTEDAAAGKRRGIFGRKRIVTLALAAVFIAAGTTVTFAAACGGLQSISEHFTAYRTDIKGVGDTSSLPVIENAWSIGKTMDGEQDALAGSIKVTSAVCDRYSLYATIEFNAEGIDIPENIPDEELTFDIVNAKSGIEGACRPVFVSREGDIFTYIIHFSESSSINGDEIVIEAHNFGRSCTVEIENIGRRLVFNSVEYCRIEFSIPVSDLLILDSVQSLNSEKIDGIIDMDAELSPFGFVVRYDESQVPAWEEAHSELLKQYGWEWFKYSTGTVYSLLSFKMKDGSTLENVHNLIATAESGSDPNSGKDTIHFSFIVPVDISQIESVTYLGAEFRFDAEAYD